ncbi:TPA: hypothetical protein ACXDAZ_002655 [Clostridium botulinum]
MNNNRFLNMTYGVEVLNGRLNTSSDQVEKKINGFDNITFTKKINGKGYASAPCVKKNMKEYIKNEGFKIATKEKTKKKIISDANPIKNIDEDVFGFMLASNGILTEDAYDVLTEDEKKNYKKDKKSGGYKLNITITKEEYDNLSEIKKKMWKKNKDKIVPVEKSTTKRRACMEMNGIIGVGTSRVKKEWGVCETNTDNMPYVLETYSDMMVGLANLNINNIGNFTIGDKSVQFKDYDIVDGIEEKELSLSKEEKYKRADVTLRSLQYLSMKSNQSNYLTDTMPKIVMLGEYSWGNNMFQGLINKDGINIEGLIEIIEEYDEFRNSDIYIGISNRIMNENFQGLRKKLQKELSEYDFIHIGGVKKAFDGYLDYLKGTL